MASSHTARRWLPAALLAALLPGCAGPSGSHGEAERGELDVVRTAFLLGGCGRLLGAVERAGLTEQLAGAGPFTLFAPTDDAFLQLPAGELDALLADHARLRRVLLHHVVAGVVPAVRLVHQDSLPTLAGDRLAVEISGQRVLIEGAGVSRGDIRASNGIIHFVDRLLLPGDDGR